MADQEIVDLLTQIRDLQKQHLENYHQALEHQRKAISLQRRALILGPVLILILFFVFLVGYLLTSRS